MTDRVDTSREAVRKTGKAFLIAGGTIAALLFLGRSHVAGWTGWDWGAGAATQGWRWFILSGLVLFGLGRFAYPVMKPIHVAWMKLAFLLAWLNTRLLLGVFFYLVLTPSGLVMRLLGKDPLRRSIDRSAKSYWIRRDPAPFDKSRYENLF